MSYQKQKNIQIPVTQPFLPPEDEYMRLLDTVWKRNWLTNNGPLVQEFEQKIKDYLGLGELVYVSSGTIALQIAIKALGLDGEIITTPFSYVATTSSIVWEGCKPVFVDIDPETWNLNPSQIADALTEQTSAILATHVFGTPCDIEGIREVANHYELKVIYDAAHAFGSQYKNQSLFDYGDISTASFHATKLLHTVEGGAIITRDAKVAERARYMRNFGHAGPGNFNGVGINGKSSEFHAAMGLANLKYIEKILQKRNELSKFYDQLLGNTPLIRPKIENEEAHNRSYYPVLFESEKQVINIQEKLKKDNIQTRRYFYPKLSDLEYVERSGNRTLPVAEDVSNRVLCLPLYHKLQKNEIEMICDKIKSGL